VPKRKAEHTAGDRESNWRPLCPFCGSLEISYLEKHGKWLCGKCEMILPYVSRGFDGLRFYNYVPIAQFKSTPSSDTYIEKGTYQDIKDKGHPPACNCADCTECELQDLGLHERFQQSESIERLVIYLIMAFLVILVVIIYLAVIS
jgi:hypothetical protein